MKGVLTNKCEICRLSLCIYVDSQFNYEGGGAEWLAGLQSSYKQLSTPWLPQRFHSPPLFSFNGPDLTKGTQIMTMWEECNPCFCSNFPPHPPQSSSNEGALEKKNALLMRWGGNHSNKRQNNACNWRERIEEMGDRWWLGRAPSYNHNRTKMIYFWNTSYFL
jgi:hypothetical protein